MSKIPRTPLILGAGGSIPFVVLAVMLWALPSDYSSATLKWLLTYSAIILTFVGALHWGVALVHPEMGGRERGMLMGWSVVPALVAWIAIFLPPLAGTGVLALMFVVQLLADHKLVAHFPITPWFLRLRRRLTLVAVICLALAVFYIINT